MAAASLQLKVCSTRAPFNIKTVCKQSPKPTRISCAAAKAKPPTRYNITLLPGDGIGPEIVSITKDVLKLTGSLEGSLYSLISVFLLLGY